MFQWLKNWVRRNKADAVKRKFRFMVDPGLVQSAETLQYKRGFNWAHDQYREGVLTLFQIRQSQKEPTFAAGARDFCRALEEYERDLS